MRQMLTWAPAGSRDPFVRATEHNGCELTLQLDGRAGEQGPVDVVITQVPNRALGGLANDLSQVDGMTRPSCRTARCRCHSATFLLVLQLVGINLAGAIVFRAVGLSPTRSRSRLPGR